MVGIYKIVNIKTGLIYIGQSEDIDYRKNEHFRRLKYNRHENSHLQNSYNKHGCKSFDFEVVEECSIEDLNQREIYYIQLYKSFDPKFGYNKTLGGDKGSPTEETRKKISESLKGHIITKDTRLKIAEGNKGKKIPKEIIDKISQRTRRTNKFIDVVISEMLREGSLTQKMIALRFNISIMIISRIKKELGLNINSYKILSQSEIDEIKELIKTRKYSQQQIADMYGVNSRKIYLIKKEMGYKLCKFQLDDEQKLAIIDLLNSKEYTIAQVAEMYGVSRDTIKRIKRKGVSEI